MILRLIIFITMLASSSCEEANLSKKKIEKTSTQFIFPFEINNPTVSNTLSKDLVEISGLTYSKESNSLLAINDEKAIIFKLDASSGAIIDQLDFGKSDDYEGIASHEEYLYITESNGNVKVVKEESRNKIIEYNDRLSQSNDIEGICYDPVSKTLLLAAKGHSETEGNTKGVKSIFTMNMSNGAIRKESFFQINVVDTFKQTADYINLSSLDRLAVTARYRRFAPSGIAVDPLTNYIYILSSGGKLLLVLDREGKVLNMTLLERQVHVQPEGITFDPKGNLYISNEGKGGKAKLYFYER